MKLCTRCRLRPVRGFTGRASLCCRCHTRTCGRPMGRPKKSEAQRDRELAA